MVLPAVQSRSMLKVMFGINYSCPRQRLIPIAHSSSEIETAKLAKVASLSSTNSLRKRL